MCPFSTGLRTGTWAALESNCPVTSMIVVGYGDNELSAIVLTSTI